MVRVTVFAALVLPTTTELKLKLLVETVTGALPVPLRFTTCGLVTALSVNVKLPVTAPISVGENVTPTVQLAPAPMPDPHVLVAIAKPALAAMLVKLSASFPRLVTVKVLGALG